MFWESAFLPIFVETLQPGDFSTVQNPIYCFITSTSSAQPIIFTTSIPLSPLCSLLNHAKISKIEHVWKSAFLPIFVETLQHGVFNAVRNAIYCFIIISSSSAQPIIFTTPIPLSLPCSLLNHPKMAEIEHVLEKCIFDHFRRTRLHCSFNAVRNAIYYFAFSSSSTHFIPSLLSSPHHSLSIHLKIVQI